MENTEFWIAVSHWMCFSAASLKQLLDQFSSSQNILKASAVELRASGLSDKKIQLIQNTNWEKVHKDYEWCQQNNCHIISFTDERYPALLHQTNSAPAVLYVRGDVELLNQPQIAMVGSRNPSMTGIEIAEEFAFALSQAGLTITSGLALGIDVACHIGSLKANGKTIAVMGTGPNLIYPTKHHKIANAIIENGALVTEYSPNSVAQAKNFPLRNRIISGLSLGVIVIEAALKSGSLITAKFAAEQNREVFAIPGSIHNPLARGCHYLIQQGAKLVESVDHILVELGALNGVLTTKKTAPPPNNNSKKLDPIQIKLLNHIGFEPTSIDAIIARSGLTSAQVSSMLLALELDGYVSISPGGYIRHH